MIELPYGQFYKQGRVSFRGVKGLNPNTLKGKTVKINGGAYKVIGVETWAMKNIEGKPFGLVVQSVSG